MGFYRTCWGGDNVEEIYFAVSPGDELPTANHNILTTEH